MHDVRPTMISLCLCTAMTLGACERARSATAGAASDGQAERSSSGAAVRLQGKMSEEATLSEWDLYYAGPPMARASVPFAGAGPEAAAVLREASWLHEVPIGVRTFYEDRLPYEAIAFEEILKRGDAEAIFEDLLRHASQAGQFYALGGLFVVNRERFQEVVRAYRPRQPWVWFSYGCGTTHWAAYEILMQLEAGNVPYLILPEGYQGDPIVLE